MGQQLTKRQQERLLKEAKKSEKLKMVLEEKGDYEFGFWLASNRSCMVDTVCNIDGNGGHLKDKSCAINLSAESKRGLEEGTAKRQAYLKKRAQEIEEESMALAMEYAAEEAKRKEAWGRYLDAHNLKNNRYAKILADVLASPEKANIDWFRLAMDALEANHQNNGLIWEAYEEGELDYRGVCVAIKAYKRHAETDYDYLLSSGVDRDSARAMIE